ncbi:hypothetical protein HDK64DRAFT_316328 [Phyllosticta capitalensis]
MSHRSRNKDDDQDHPRLKGDVFKHWVERAYDAAIEHPDLYGQTRVFARKEPAADWIVSRLRGQILLETFKNQTNHQALSNLVKRDGGVYDKLVSAGYVRIDEHASEEALAIKSGERAQGVTMQLLPDDLIASIANLDGSPLDLNDDYVKRFWTRKIVSKYDKMGLTYRRRPFVDQRMAHEYLQDIMRGRLPLPVFKHHNDAEALKILCREALKDLISMGYISMIVPRPFLVPLPCYSGLCAHCTQHYNEAHDGTTNVRITARGSGAATQDPVPATRGISVEWQLHLWHDVAVPEGMRPLRFSNREAAYWYMINTVSVKRTLPVTDTLELKKVWRHLCLQALQALKDDGHFEFPTHKEYRQQETARAQAEAEKKAKDFAQAKALAQGQVPQQAQKQEIRAAETTRVASWGADFQRGHAAGFAAGLDAAREALREAGKEAGQAAGTAAATNLLRSEQPSLGDDSGTTHARNTPAPFSALAAEIDRIDRGSNTGQSLSVTNTANTSDTHFHRSPELEPPSNRWGTYAVVPPPASQGFGLDQGTPRNSGSTPALFQHQPASTGSVLTGSSQAGPSIFKPLSQKARGLSGRTSVKSLSGNLESLPSTGAAGHDRKPKRRLPWHNLDSEEAREPKKARGGGGT